MKWIVSISLRAADIPILCAALLIRKAITAAAKSRSPGERAGGGQRATAAEKINHKSQQNVKKSILSERRRTIVVLSTSFVVLAVHCASGSLLERKSF